MKKKIFSILLSLAMVITMMPVMTMTAFATDYGVKINGVAITDSTKDDFCSDGGSVKYTPTDGTNPAKLTLTNANIIGTANYRYAIECLEDTVIELRGDCTVTSIQHSAGTAIYSGNDIEMTFTGSGNLTATGKEGGLQCEKKCVIDTNGSMTLVGTSAAGLYQQDNNNAQLIITKVGKLIAYGNSSYVGALMRHSQSPDIEMPSNYIMIGSEEYEDTNEAAMKPLTRNGYFYGFVDSPNTPAKSIVIKSVWPLLAGAVSGDAQETVSGVFTVSDDASTGTRTIKLFSNITAASDDSALVVKASSDGGKNIILDLNGHTLDRGLSGETSAVVNGNIINVEYSGKLIIQDNSTSQTGKITGGTAEFGGAIVTHGETVLQSGTITGCKALSTTYDSGVHNSRKGRGGAIYVMKDSTDKSGSFTMSGGKIENCSASVAGGGVFVVGTMIMSNGKISNCNVSGIEESGIVKAKGGGVYLYGDSTFQMYGGEISNNKLYNVADTRGAGLYAATMDIHLGGTAKIINNRIDVTNIMSNMYMYDNVLIHFVSGQNAPAPGMNIGITTKKVLSAEATGCPISVACNASYAPYFFADRPNENVIHYNDQLQLVYDETSEPTPLPIWIDPKTLDEKTTEIVEESKVAVSKTTAYKNGKIKVVFKALTLSDGTKVTKYQVRRAVNKKFTKKLKKYNATCKASSKTVSFTNAKGLKKGTRYYYKIRGKVQLSDGSWVYTKWSKVKSIKCKKTRK